MGEGVIQYMQSSLQGIKTAQSRNLLDIYWHWFMMHGTMNIKFIGAINCAVAIYLRAHMMYGMEMWT
jgi:hypothetical protein